MPRDRNRENQDRGLNRPFTQLGQQTSRSHQGGQDREEKTFDEIWTGYLEGGYFDGDGNLKDEYVSREKVEALVEEMSKARPQLTNHQLRRFFQHCRAIESRLKARRSSWRSEGAEFLKLDIAAADAYGKTSKKIPRLFHDFIKRNVAAVKTDKDFLEGFLRHFEALVGFGARHLREKERN